MRLDRINPPPPGFQERLLKTAAADVPPAVCDAARVFCDAMREVEAGWVCRVERRQPGGEAEERLALAVKLRGRIEQRGDGLADQHRVIGRLSQRHRELIAELVGISFLADRAVAAWETNGVSVFRRALH